VHPLEDLVEESVTRDGDREAWNNFIALGPRHRIGWRVVTQWIGSVRSDVLTLAQLGCGRADEPSGRWV
jgi:hypothetical protein